MKKRTKMKKLLSIIVLIIHLAMLTWSIYWLYMYNFGGVLFCFMVPNWVLIMNSILNIAGIYLSIRLYKEKIDIKLFLILTVLIWLIVILTQICITMDIHSLLKKKWYIWGCKTQFENRYATTTESTPPHFRTCWNLQ